MLTVPRFVLLAIQVMVAALFGLAAAVMWGPLMSAPLTAKLYVAVIVLWPVIGLVVTARNGRLLSLGTTSVVALLAGLHLIIVTLVLTTP